MLTICSRCQVIAAVEEMQHLIQSEHFGGEVYEDIVEASKKGTIGMVPVEYA